MAAKPQGYGVKRFDKAREIAVNVLWDFQPPVMFEVEFGQGQVVDQTVPGGRRGEGATDGHHNQKQCW